MSRKRDVGRYYVLEVVWKRIGLLSKPSRSLKYLHPMLYSSKRDAKEAVSIISSDVKYNIGWERKICEDFIFIQSITVKKCALSVYDTSKL